jgi:hypothetical protein
MLYNYAQASLKPEERTQRIETAQRDLMKLLEQGGTELVEANGVWRAHTMALIREVVQDVFAMTDFVPLFVNRTTGEHGMTYEIEQEFSTTRVVEYAPGSEPRISAPVKGTYTFGTAEYELAWGITLMAIQRGQKTVESYAKDAAEAKRRHYAQLVLQAINVACATGVTDLKGRNVRTTAAQADIQKTEIDAAIRRMGAAGLTIIGSGYALDPINTFTGALSQNLSDELNARGVMGTYRGQKLLRIQDDYNQFIASWTKVNGIDLDKLIFIAGPEAGATLMEKPMDFLSWNKVDTVKGEWQTGERMDHGVTVTRPDRYQVIQLP